ncbi:hypothetical protein G9A89_021996 [Geosiphon pyriformis]|nr:hypothetical protein G9A89_021996 [Geosiphon pyriformis]
MAGVFPDSVVLPVSEPHKQPPGTLYDKTKPFFDFETTVGLSVAIIKKIVKKSGSSGGFKSVLSRKKRKDVALEENVSGKEILTKESGGYFWGFETGNITESENINMEEKCLVKETSFNYGKNGTITDEKCDQMPKGPSIKTKKTLDKPLGKINFSSLNVDDDVLLDVPLEFSSSLKNLVLVSVRKFFALDIRLDKVVEKSSQEKLMIVRRLFSKVNGFRGASTPSKFSEIIHASFTSEASLMQAMEKAKTVNILVNTDLKKSTSHSDQAVVVKEIPVGILAETQKAVVEFEQSDQANLVTDKWSILIEKDAVCVARADFDKETWNKRNHHRALLYILPMGTNAHDIWNFLHMLRSDVLVCFNSTKSLNAAMGTILVLRSTNLRWSSLVSARCAKCEKLGHISLNCAESGKVSPGGSFHRVLSDADKSRLAAIYAKQSALVTHPVSFGGLSWVKITSGSSSFSLFGQVVSVNVGFFLEMKPSLLVVTEINDRFAALECSLASLAEYVDMLAKKLETLESTNQGVDIVMNKDSSVAAGGETVAEAVVFDSSVIRKMEDTLKNLAITVMGLLAKINNAGLKVATCNVRGMNNPVKQDNIVHWHKDMNNLISIFMETKLKRKIHSWIVKKFEGICVFTSWLDSGYLESGIAVVMNNSLARHVCKISKADEINSLVSIAINEFFLLFLVVISMKIVLVDVPALKNVLIWIVKVIDYVLVSANLVGALIHYCVLEVGEHFDTDHWAVSVFMGLGGLLDAQLNFLHKKVNMDHWKYNIKNANDAKWCEFKVLMVANIAMFSEEFVFSVVIVFSTNDFFKKKWFKDFDSIFTKGSSRFYRLEILVLRIVNVFCEQDFARFPFLINHWASLDSNKALVVQVFLDFGVDLECIRSALFGVQKFYHASKLTESLRARESSIKFAIDRCMESFVHDKSHTIRSVLERSFCKVELDHLVVDNELILKLELVKAKVNVIMEGWTRRHKVVSDISSKWSHQYQPLEHVFDNAFTDLFGVVSDLLDGKAVGISGIPNELWKHCDKSVMGMLLELLNICLIIMTDFGLTDGQESVCGYKLNSHFISKNGHPELVTGLSSFFTTGAFVDNTIWVGNNQSAIQHILNVVSEFFWINDISINTNKTVVIPINCKIVQSEGKIASLVNFANSGGTLGHMFFYRSHDLQVLCWHPVYSLSSPVYICVSLLNNFLAGVYGVAFVDQLCDYYNVIFNWKTFKYWKRLDPYGPVPNWFSLSVTFLSEVTSFPVGSSGFGGVGAPLSILESQKFRLVCDHLSHVSAGSLSVYTDNSLRDLGTIQKKTGAAVFFEDIGLGLGVRVNSLLSSTLVELQAIALALECVPPHSLVCLYSDNQTALDVCELELRLICPDFHVRCWVEH